ncbi:MAG: UvrD-helicase domain-containing protein, partial [Clostridiales bacterium]|nr:UvrD-helicase domain-containing protein [Clostridiales bacterium]
MAEWTPAQRQAIDARNHSILVSAAAGSGKTSVLVERLMELLRGGARIERVLVVTFTHAAAAEMRSRLMERLSEEARESAHLRRQLQAINRADISTLHTFCNRLIKRHFQAVGADPGSRVGDEGRMKVMLDNALQAEMEALYEQPDHDRQCLIDQYTDKDIQAMALQLYHFLMALAHPWQWVEQHLQMPDAASLMAHPWYGWALKEAQARAEAALQLCQEALELTAHPQGPQRYRNNAQVDREMVLFLHNALFEEGRLPEGLDPTFGDLSRVAAPPQEDESLRERYTDMRKQLKDLVAAIVTALPAGQQAMDKAADDIAWTAPALRALCALVQRMHGRYGEDKRQRQLWDYDDLEHLALQCLQDPLVQQDMGQRFDALFVDEYQDISRIQEAIIQALHGEDASLFMVGDVKQSIYRFRQADPGLFMRKYRQFHQEAEAEERLIRLSENFRSRTNILQAVNHVFEQTMLGDALEIDYDAEAALRPGLPSQSDPPVELHLILPAQGEGTGNEDDEQLRGFQREAVVIAERIEQLVGTPLGGDKNARPIRYRDMVILLRSASSRAAGIAEVLKARNIPVYSDADAQFFDFLEVQDMLNLLHVLNNPLEDIPLLGLLKSPIMSFTDEKLATIRVEGDPNAPFHELFYARRSTDPQVEEAVSQIERWRFLCQNSRLDDFLHRLLRETGLYTLAGVRNKGDLRRANLRLLCERAGPNPFPQTLHGFLQRVTEARRQDTTKAAATLGAGEDVVRIMTMHKSKGLEFPVVFLPDLSHRFRLDGQGELLLLDAEVGMALRKVDPDLRMTHHTLAGKAILLKKSRETRSEEARLLYVAMTRARDHLILLAAPASMKSTLSRWRAPVGAHRASVATCMMDWVGASLWPALMEQQDVLWQAPGGSRWQVVLRAGEQIALGAPEDTPPLPPMPSPGQQPSDWIINHMRPLEIANTFPQKLSVTELVARSGLQLEETAATKRLPWDQQQRGAPRDEALRRGIITHRALGGLDLHPLRGLQGQALQQMLHQGLDRLVEGRVLSEKERAMVRVDTLAGFYQSELGCRLLMADRVEREWPFMLDAGSMVVLQGVLDCCFMENSAWVLIDYKTDRADPDTIYQRYRDQMRWYIRALREISGQPVAQAHLYCLEAGVALQVE